MGRPKNEHVWTCFTKTGTKGVECKYCKKKYIHGNVNKMESHLLACFKCPEEVRVKIRDHAGQSNFNETSQSGASGSSTESDCSGRSHSTSSTSKIARKGLIGFLDKMSVHEKVSSKDSHIHRFTFLIFTVHSLCNFNL